MTTWSFDDCWTSSEEIVAYIDRSLSRSLSLSFFQPAHSHPMHFYELLLSRHVFFSTFRYQPSCQYRSNPPRVQYSTASVVRRARRLLHYASVTHRGVTHTRSHTRSRSSYVQARGQVKKKGVKTPFLLLFLTSLMERPDLLNQAPRGAQFENELLVI